jgi:membrane dipeptidase
MFHKLSPPEHRRNEFPNTATLEPLRETLQQLDLIHRLVEKYSFRLELVDSAARIMTVFGSGKIACMIGVEGLHQVGDCPSVLRMYHKLGVRYVTLTHNWANAYADSAVSCRSNRSFDVNLSS